MVVCFYGYITNIFHVIKLFAIRLNTSHIRNQKTIYANIYLNSPTQKLPQTSPCTNQTPPRDKPKSKRP